MNRRASFSLFAMLAGALTLAPACNVWSAKPAPAAASASDAKKGLPPLDTEPPAKPKVVALGDSITAGLGVFQVEAYPALLQQRLETEGYVWEVVNAGESGDTSATALRRLDWVLDKNVRILIVAVGGNDALRGIPPRSMQDNINAIIAKATEKGIDVLLAGMQAPPNLGTDYQAAFNSAFGAVRRDNPTVKFMPFLLEDVAGNPSLNQADGIHPTVAGQKIIADKMYDYLKPMVDDVVARSGGGGY